MGGFSPGGELRLLTVIVYGLACLIWSATNVCLCFCGNAKQQERTTVFRVVYRRAFCSRLNYSVSSSPLSRAISDGDVGRVFGLAGVPLERSVLAQWVRAGDELVSPIVLSIRRHVLDRARGRRLDRCAVCH